MLEYLFGNRSIEKVLFYLYVNEKCYAYLLKSTFDSPLFSFQRALERLERGGVIVAELEGKTRFINLIPAILFLKSSKSFLLKSIDSYHKRQRIIIMKFLNVKDLGEKENLYDRLEEHFS